MQVAIVCAGFTPVEADQLRRSMATFKSAGGVDRFRDKLIGGMVARGYERDFAERTFAQLEGFGSYGFPESHAASFALIAYASAWMKCHHPDAFCAALLNSQPMGFCAPAQLVRDAREHGVQVRPVCVNASRWDCTLEPTNGRRFAVRLGLRMVRGLSNADAARLVAYRGEQPYASVEDIQRRVGLPRRRSSGWPRPMPFTGSTWIAGRPCGRCAAWPRMRRPCRCSPRLPLPTRSTRPERRSHL
jgi:error-prone DNA polymerase